MKLNFYPAFQTNTIFNSYGINQSIANKKTGSTDSSEQEEREDLLILSPQGSTHNLLNNLMKLKTEITDRKNALLHSVKDGGSMEAIQAELDFYNEQLENIDQQIADAMAKETEKQTEKSKEVKDDEPKTKEEILTKRMTDITEISRDIDRIQILDSTKTTLDGRITVLESELSLDASHSSRSTNYKKDQIEELEKRSKNLSSEIASGLVEIAEDEAKANDPDSVKEEDRPGEDVTGMVDPDKTE